MAKLIKKEGPRMIRIRQETLPAPPIPKIDVGAKISPLTDLFGILPMGAQERPKNALKRPEKAGVNNQPADPAPSRKKAVPGSLEHGRPRKAILSDAPLWTEEVARIEGYFSTHPVPQAPVRLDRHTVIEDPAEFILSHLETLKANPGRRLFIPYLDRLRGLYAIAQEVGPAGRVTDITL